MEPATETEKRIILSAEKLFYRKGKAGASMQDIADDAGINRTLLNYYFRTKDQLFEAVFRNAMSRFVPNLAAMIRSDREFSDYVPEMVSTIIDTMLGHPQIPIFVLQELSSNPNRMQQMMRDMGIDPDLAVQKIRESERSRGMATERARQLIMNVLSLCIFPFAARPLVVEILSKGDKDAFRRAMEQRKQLIPALVETMMN